LLPDFYQPSKGKPARLPAVLSLEGRNGAFLLNRAAEKGVLAFGRAIARLCDQSLASSASVRRNEDGKPVERKDVMRENAALKSLLQRAGLNEAGCKRKLTQAKALEMIGAIAATCPHTVYVYHAKSNPASLLR